MNKIILIFALCITTLAFQSCKDEEEFTRFEKQNWQTVSDSDFSVNMTVICGLPENLLPYQSEQDEMAVFIDSKCRGVAEVVDGDYYITVKGTPEEASKFEIRYYSNDNKYLYVTTETYVFEPDDVLGTTDEPLLLKLVNIN